MSIIDLNRNIHMFTEKDSEKYPEVFKVLKGTYSRAFRDTLDNLGVTFESEYVEKEYRYLLNIPCNLEVPFKLKAPHSRTFLPSLEEILGSSIYTEGYSIFEGPIGEKDPAFTSESFDISHYWATFWVCKKDLAKGIIRGHYERSTFFGPTYNYKERASILGDNCIKDIDVTLRIDNISISLANRLHCDFSIILDEYFSKKRKSDVYYNTFHSWVYSKSYEQNIKIIKKSLGIS